MILLSKHENTSSLWFLNSEGFCFVKCSIWQLKVGSPGRADLELPEHGHLKPLDYLTWVVDQWYRRERAFQFAATFHQRWRFD